MATQSDLDKMRKKLSDLDAKLKSMRGNQKAPVARPPNFVDMGRDVPRQPIDMVRDLGFGSAMANQDYENRMREAFARLAAERGGVGAVIDRLPTLAGSILNPETLNKAKEEYMNQNPGDVNRKVRADLIKSRYLGQIGREMAGFDKWFETNYINNPNSALQEQERMSLRNDLIRGPQAGGFTQGRLMGAPSGQQNSNQMNFDQIAKDLTESQYQNPQYKNPNQMNFDKIAQGIQGMNLNPQSQQMQNYNNFLQQGIQRSNTMNQDAATNFANMQAGAPTTEPATPSTAKPTMPVAGLGMQKSKAIPLPKTFSTVNTPSARFG